MPFINIKLAAPAPQKELQDLIAKEITQIMIKHLNKAPERTVICFEEVGDTDFYFGGQSVAQIKKRG